MRFRLRVDDDEHGVTIGTGGALTVDQDQFEAKVTAPSADRRTVQIDDTTYEVRIVQEQPNPGSYLVEIAGERIWLTVSDVTRGRASRALKSGAGAGLNASGAPPATGARTSLETATDGIRAPMPGKVVKVLVEVGQEVEAGQVLVILEAMKMENELRAPRNGVVTVVYVKEGDPVEAGGRLLVVE